MTREAAIQTLNVMMCQYSHIRKSDSEWEAVNMAIEALQEIDILQATIDCLEWTIEQLSRSQPKEIAKAV